MNNERVLEITKKITLGVACPLKDKDEVKLARQVRAEIAEYKKKGLVPQVPNE